MGIVREREIHALEKEIKREMKPNETITDAITRINEKIAMSECEVSDLEDQLSHAEYVRDQYMDIHDKLLKYKELSDPVYVPAKRKARPEKKTLGAYL